MACMSTFSSSFDCFKDDNIDKVNRHLENLGIPIRVTNKCNVDFTYMRTKMPNGSFVNGYAIGEILPCDWEENHLKLIFEVINSGSNSAIFKANDGSITYVDEGNLFQISGYVSYQIIGDLSINSGINFLPAVAGESLQAGDFVFIQNGKAFKSQKFTHKSY